MTEIFPTMQGRNGEVTTVLEAIEEQILAYRTDDSIQHSPVWLWFSKVDQEITLCLLCNKRIPVKSSCTTGMSSHLKHHHRSDGTHNVNAWRVCEELLELKELRVMENRKKKIISSKRKPNARGGDTRIAKRKSEKSKLTQNEDVIHEYDGLQPESPLENQILEDEYDDGMKPSPTNSLVLKTRTHINLLKISLNIGFMKNISTQKIGGTS